MTYSANVYKVMIASPRDVAIEKQIAKEVIHEFNSLYSEHTGIVLMPTSWETNSSPEMGGRPQAIINKQVLKDADLLIGIFWTRIGTPTGKAESGTVEEIQEHIKQDKPAMIYFSRQPVVPESIDMEQYNKVQEFKKSIREHGLFYEFDTESDFSKNLSRHLYLTVAKNKYFIKTNDQPSQNDSFPSEEMISKAKWQFLDTGLEAETKQLLLEAAKDKNGIIIKSRTMSGTTIQTNGNNFITEQNPRIIAKWENALDQLYTNNFIEDRGYKGEVFALTHLGYEYADILQNG